MSRLKTHFGDTVNGVTITACGRGQQQSKNISYVDCLACKGTAEFAAAVQEYKDKAEAAFNAQTPRTIVPQFGRVNAAGVMECYKCQGVLFRERPRSLFSYHYVCEGCGTSIHPMTETGMST